MFPMKKGIRVYLYFVCVMCLLLLPTHGFAHTHDNGHIHHEHSLCEACESCCHVMAPLPTTTEKVRIGKSRSVFSFPPETTYKNVLLEKEKRPPRL